MRRVYVIQGPHALGDPVAEVYTEATRRGFLEQIECCSEATNQIIKEIALQERVTELYWDSRTARDASNANEMAANNGELEKAIQRISNAIMSRDTEEVVERILTRNYSLPPENRKGKSLKERYNLSRNPGERMRRGAIEELRILANCRESGVYLTLRETEDERTLQEQDELIQRHGKTGLKIGMQVRDKKIYERMKLNAGMKSILYMGETHKLEQFYYRTSGFEVVSVRINEKGHEYKSANVERIPDFFKEIVERRYAEMKVRTTNP